MLRAEKMISWLSLDETMPSRRMKLYSLLGKGGFQPVVYRRDGLLN